MSLSYSLLNENVLLKKDDNINNKFYVSLKKYLNDKNIINEELLNSLNINIFEVNDILTSAKEYLLNLSDNSSNDFNNSDEFDEFKFKTNHNIAYMMIEKEYYVFNNFNTSNLHNHSNIPNPHNVSDLFNIEINRRRYEFNNFNDNSNNSNNSNLNNTNNRNILKSKDKFLNLNVDEMIVILDRLINIFTKKEDLSFKSIGDYINNIKNLTKKSWYDYCDSLSLYNQIEKVVENIIKFEECSRILCKSIINVTNSDISDTSAYVQNINLEFINKLDDLKNYICLNEHKLISERNKLIYDYYNTLLKGTIIDFIDPNIGNKCNICYESNEMIFLDTCSHTMCNNCAHKLIEMSESYNKEGKCGVCRVNYSSKNIKKIFF